jgi:PmbA protein
MSSCHVGVSVVAEKGDQKSQGAEYCVRRNFKDLKTTGEIAAEAAIKAYKMLDPRMVKTQKAALIVDPDASRSILRGILSAMDGERALKGASYLRDRKGKAVASSLITLIDDGQRPRGTGSAPFDGEGVPTRKRVLLEKGVLKGFMYNCAAAHRAGEKSTGNASRYSFSRLPGIGAHNFYMTAGKATRDEVIRSTRRGLLLKGVTGYGINPVNGHFSGGASGFWIEDGEIVFPVKGLAIAGTADEMLMSVDIVADDLDLEKSFTAPTFRIPEIQIGGE